MELLPSSVVKASYTSTSSLSTDKDTDFQVAVEQKEGQTYLSSLTESIESLKNQVNNYLTIIVEEGRRIADHEKTRLEQKKHPEEEEKEGSETSDSTPKKLKSN